MFTRFAFLLGLLAVPLLAQSTPQETAPLTNPEALKEAIRLHLARNGDEVLVTWDIPAINIKGIDIYRNTREQPSGRSRLDFVKASPALFRDKVPDAEATYWYWLKIVLPTGEIYNAGPIPTPSGKIWTP